MKVSLNIVKQYVDIKLGVEELVERINMQLGGVEDVTDLSEKYKDVVVVKVVECEKHPNADKLSVCMVDDDGAVGDVERDERGLVRVVCGAPNVHAGMFAAWLPPKSTVPASFDDEQPFILETKDLRGVKSNGMLAAADELALGTDHEGIIEITQRDLFVTTPEDALKPGARFAELFGLDDIVIDIENKMFTHRPDCFGQLGVARELFGITQGEPASDKATDIRFNEPDWYWSQPQFENASGLELTVTNDAPEKSPRFTAVALKNVTVKPSPLWLQIELVRLGSKAINNIVDVTNYAMLLTGQPTHAYDYDKLRGHKLGVRMATNGEKASLLNGKSYELTDQDIVIVDGEGVVGLGGVMGGDNSEVSNDTRHVVLECANFDMYAIRKTSMRYGLFTDAVTRFSKGQSSLQQGRILRLLMTLIFDVAGGEQASAVFDLPDVLRGDTVHPENSVRPSFINERLGLGLTGFAIGNILRYVNFAVHAEDSSDTDAPLNVTAPFWRTDIVDKEDIVEEVGRLYGFDKLPVELPTQTIAPVAKNPMFELKKAVRASLSRAGANEVLTYSFVHEYILEKAGQDKAKAFQLSNALSPELQYYRLTVLPSLLDKVHPNIKAGFDEFVLFELGKGHEKDLIDEEGLPAEQAMLDLVYASKKPQAGAAFYHVRELVQQLALDLGFTLKFEPMDEKVVGPFVDPFDSQRTALICAYNGGKEYGIIGAVGELKPSVKAAFKLPDYIAAASLDVYALAKLYARSSKTYTVLSKFPKVTQDISLKVPTETTYDQVFDTAWKAVEAGMPGQCNAKLEPLSIYQSKEDSTHKTITLRLTIASYERTLTDKDVSTLLDTVASNLKNTLSADRI